MVYSILAILIAISLYYFLNISSYSEPSPVDCKLELNKFLRFKITALQELPGECFFRGNYRSARESFISLGSEAGSELIKLMIVEDLSTDIVIIKGRPDQLIVHVSGTHGVEAFAGSSIQLAALKLLKQEKKELGIDYENIYPTIAFVHALNPYGFNYLRRVNENNIDLNRNFLDLDKFNFVKSRDPNFAGYQEADMIFNPTYKHTKNIYINDILSYLLMAYVALVKGIGHMKQALVSGNYYKSTGLGFGGFELSKSASSLIKFVNTHDIFKSAQEIIFIDVHTGLGPRGVDTLVIQGSDTNVLKDSIFKTTYSDSNKKVINGGLKEDMLSGYNFTVGMTNDYFCGNKVLSPHLDKSSRLCVIQEFGTVPTLIVGKTQIDENYAFHFGTEEEKKLYSTRMLSSFFVNTTDWKRKIVKRGLTVILESIDYFSSKPIVV